MIKDPLNCDFCGLMLANDNEYISHMDSHTGKKPFECTECGAQINEPESLIKHLTTHRGEKPLTCAICLTHYASTSEIKSHLAQHSITNEQNKVNDKVSYAKTLKKNDKQSKVKGKTEPRRISPRLAETR